MTFRDRLLLLSCLLVTICICIAVFLGLKSAEEMSILQSKAKALSIAATVASQLDGDKVQAITSRNDEQSETFLAIKKQLHQAMIVNRREDTFVRQIYTVFPAPDGTKDILIGINPAQEREYQSHVGDVLHIESGIHIDTATASEGFLQDQWGRWLAASAPLRNTAGAVIGAVVVEIPEEKVLSRIDSLKSNAAIGLGIGLLFALSGAWGLSYWISKPLSVLKNAMRAVQAGNFTCAIVKPRNDEFGAVTAVFNQMVQGLQERDTVKSAFSRYVSQQVLDAVMTSGSLPAVHGNRKKITALFADIRDFTKLSERLSPERVVEVLNEYFDKMVDIVFKHHGTLDKFIGDGIMVIFGAPVDDPYQEEHAVRAALEMQLAISELRTKWSLQDGVDLRIGIGINSGNAIVGNIGSAKRMDYTAIGDTVNLASRLETATKEYGVDILISDYTYQGVRGMFPAKRVGEVALKGRNDSVLAYTLTS
jgi:adenylate cyclase